MKVEIFNKIPGNFKFENLVELNKNVVKIQIKQSILNNQNFHNHVSKKYERNFLR